MDTPTEPKANRPGSNDPVGDLLPRADVDSRWWYWIAAVPLYFVVAGVLAGVFFVGFLFDLFLTGGLLSLFGAFVAVPVVGLVGLALAVLFPVATYVDARAVAETGGEWTPDPVVWSLAALASVVLTAYAVSVLVSLYYLYRRHETVGTP
jgi:hypothetical protein